MSNAVSALNGASSNGFATVSEAGLRGMITLRGDLSDVDLKNAVTGVTGVDFPDQGGVNHVGDQGIAWMSPDELLIMVPHEKSAEVADTLTKALAGQHHLVADVSDARAVFTIAGKGAREVLAKVSPVDLGAQSMQPGMIRRTRLAQVAGAFWMINETDFEVVSFRSTARYTFNLLANAAKSGSQVDYF